MRCYRPCWIGRLRESYDNYVVARSVFCDEAIPCFKRRLLRNVRSQRHAIGIAAGVTVPDGRGIAPFALLRGCFARRVVIVPERSEWDTVRAGSGVQGRVVKRPDRFPRHLSRLASLSTRGLRLTRATMKPVRSGD